MKQEANRAGSLPFMAPELLDGKCAITPALDVWSLGCVLFEMLTGDKPFSGTRDEIKRRILELNIRYPDYLSEEVMALFASIFVKESEERASIKQLLASKWILGDPLEFKTRKKLTLKELKEDKSIVFRVTNNQKLDNMYKQIKIRASKKHFSLKPMNTINFAQNLRSDASNLLSEETNSSRPIIRLSTINNQSSIGNGPSYLRPIGRKKTEHFSVGMVRMKQSLGTLDRKFELPLIGKNDKKENSDELVRKIRKIKLKV